MTTTETNASSPAGATGRRFSVADSGFTRRLVDRVTYPAERPFSALTAYYVVLIGLAALVVWQVPSAQAMISGQRLMEIIAGGDRLFDSAEPGAVSNIGWSTSLDMALAMIGAFLLMMPTSWAFMAERRRKGFDQSLMQTMIVLSVTIAGVVVIVRGSVALAFSLAGIVGAVRFRTNLTDTRDTLYIFNAIGVGLAAGVQALAAALVLSMIFNYVILAFWRTDYGMCELGRSSSHLLVGAGAGGSGNEKKKKKKRKDYNAVVVVRASDTEGAQPAVAELLNAEVSRFKLAEMELGSTGKGHLKYLVRLGKSTNPRDLEDALLERGAPHVIGVRVH